MTQSRVSARAVVLIVVGNGRVPETVDTIESVWHYLGGEQPIIANLDHEDDGTEAALRKACGARLHFVRNPHPGGIGAEIVMPFLTHKSAFGLRCAIEAYDAEVLLKLDTDALVTGYGLIEDALAFMARNPEVGIFGRHLINVDGTIKDYRMHTRRLNRELSVWNRLRLRGPAYAGIARRALARGWGLGENVFGGACFFTWRCLRAMDGLGYLRPPRQRWNSLIADDVYFTMCAMAAGFDRGQFGVPNGPMCMAWQFLPLPPKEIQSRGYKLVHSVDKGHNTSREDNEGMTAREFFRAVRQAESPPQAVGRE
jgi:hypothetical protein